MNQSKINEKNISNQVVLLLQGGGALGAYQAGIYCGMNENNIEPDWIIGTSIGAINAAIIAGNPPEERSNKLKQFWDVVSFDNSFHIPNNLNPFNRIFENMQVVMNGVNGFFKPKPYLYHLEQFPYGIEKASHYDTTPLKKTLSELIDFNYLNSKKIRLMLGAVNANSGEIRYFDNHKMGITVEHILASAAMPPAFPAIMIDEELYWDGGISSNSPLDEFLNTMPRVSSVIFAAQLWNKKGPKAKSIWDIKGRLKDLQFSSRASILLKKESEIHDMRRAVDILVSKMSDEQLKDPETKKITALGCKSQFHFIQFIAPRLDYDDYTKDINFSKQTISTRINMGMEDMASVIKNKLWEQEIEQGQGLLIHDVSN